MMASNKININTATYDELISLPGIGPRTAKAIIELRETYGSVDREQLAEIPYIRLSYELLQILDFSQSDAADRQKYEIDRISERIDRADLLGPRSDRRPYRSATSSTKSYRASVPPQAHDSFDTDDRDDKEYPSLHYLDRSRPVQPNRYSSRNVTAESTQRRLHSLPKTLSYDGTTSWKAFQLKFNKYAEAQGWSGKECKDYLCLSLMGKASEFYANLCERDDHIEYYDLIHKFEKRFGFTELPETALIGFNSARQGSSESLHDWADRVVSHATEAFRNLPEEHMWSQAILRFCHGCYDKDAGEKAANSRPKTLEQAIDQVKWAIHTHSAVHGRYKPAVRQTKHENPSVCTVRDTKTPSKLEARVDSLESKVADINQKYDRIISKLDFVCRRLERQRSPSPRTRTPVECYTCKGNHYQRDCPSNRKNLDKDIKKEEKKVQFVEEEDSRTEIASEDDSDMDLGMLNSAGSGDEA